MDDDDGFAPMEVDEGPPQYMQGPVPAPAPAALGFVDPAGAPEAPMPDLEGIRRNLDELRNTGPRFEGELVDVRLPRGDDSTNDEILDGVWKLYRTYMERRGAPRHYPTFEELQQVITSDRANVASALGISQQRLQQILSIDAAKWILGKEDTVAPLSGDTDSRRPELIQAAKMVLRNAGHNAEDLIDPINEVKSLGLLRGGRRRGKKSTRRKGKNPTRRKGKKPTRRKGKKPTGRKGKKTRRR